VAERDRSGVTIPDHLVASLIDYSDQTLRIGTYNAPLDQLNLLEGDNVTVQIVE
jgi:hypothetical protein